MTDQHPWDDYDDPDREEDEDEADWLDCGLGPDGQCSKAGSEDCDWECPHSHGPLYAGSGFQQPLLGLGIIAQHGLSDESIQLIAKPCLPHAIEEPRDFPVDLAVVQALKQGLFHAEDHSTIEAGR